MTASPGTGPPGDVGPNGVGGYLYLEASSPTVQGDEAQLISPFIFISPEKIYCLRRGLMKELVSVGGALSLDDSLLLFF